MSYRESLAAILLLATVTSLVPAQNLSKASPVTGLEGSRPGEERDDNALKMKFCWCPKGTFRMGSLPDEPDRDKNEGPVNVTLSRGFWLGKYEVTQDEWRRVMGTSVEDQKQKLIEKSLFGEGPRHSMYYVSHVEAEDFCVKLTAAERKAGRLPSGWLYRLPTEAQWEYACRAGTTSATAFGTSLGSEQANFNGNFPYNGAAKGPYLVKTTALDHFQQGERVGLIEMHGNVCEWCRDGFGAQLPGGVDPVGPSGASVRVIRGGSLVHQRQVLPVSVPQQGRAPESRDFYLGFRVARVSSE